MMALGGQRRLPALGGARAGAGAVPGLNLPPLNNMQPLVGVNSLGAANYMGGLPRYLGVGGARMNGNILRGGLAGYGLGNVPGLGAPGGIGPLNGLGPLNDVGGLNSRGALNNMGNMLAPLAARPMYGNQLGPALPLARAQNRLDPLQPWNLLQLQALSANTGLSYSQLLELFKPKTPHQCCDKEGQNKRTGDFKQKDVTIRGKAYAIRASYLTDFSKFEGDLTKFMDKKKENDVPDKVVGMLVDHINTEQYSSDSVLDEVQLNILASNVGAKSVIEYSLKQLNGREHVEGIADHDEMTKIVYAIVMSSKVDDALKGWLKDLLVKDDHRLFKELSGTAEYLKMHNERPEVHVEVMRLVGRRAAPNDKEYPKM